MSLLDLKKYLQSHSVSNLASIMHHFNIDADLARNLLHHWQRKGCVKKCMKTQGCGTRCSKCDPALIELYQWVAE